MKNNKYVYKEHDYISTEMTSNDVDIPIIASSTYTYFDWLIDVNPSRVSDLPFSATNTNNFWTDLLDW